MAIHPGAKRAMVSSGGVSRNQKRQATPNQVAWNGHRVAGESEQALEHRRRLQRPAQVARHLDVLDRLPVATLVPAGQIGQVSLRHSRAL